MGQLSPNVARERDIIGFVVEVQTVVTYGLPYNTIEALTKVRASIVC